jgi:hypothetical protein
LGLSYLMRRGDRSNELLSIARDRALNDTDNIVRREALTLLSRNFHEHPETANILLQVRDNDPDEEIKAYAQELLSAFERRTD